MRVAYALAPAVGWFVAGSLKFIINSVGARQLAWGQMGYGGIPSTHATVVSTTALLLGLQEGFNTPAFSIAATPLRSITNREIEQIDKTLTYISGLPPGLSFRKMRTSQKVPNQHFNMKVVEALVAAIAEAKQSENPTPIRLTSANDSGAYITGKYRGRAIVFEPSRPGESRSY